MISLPLRYLIILPSAATIALNIYIIRTLLAEKIDDAKKHLKIDRLLLIQSTVYDMLMGIYISGLVSASLTFGSSYCKHDISWRGSKWCSLLGAIFNMSSLGSLIFVAYVSFIRSYKRLRPFFSGVSISSAIVTSLVFHIFNITNAFVFLLPFQSVQEILSS